MQYLVTGAAGGLGGAAVEALLKRGIAGADVTATSRDPRRLEHLADRGVGTGTADYADRASLRRALEGTDRLLLVSSNSRGDRVAEHRAVIESAAEVGIERVVYTSLLHAATAASPIVASHRQTELLLEKSGVDFTILRNGQYFENYFAQLPFVRLVHALHGSAGDGRISGALRAEYGEAAAVVLTEDDHVGAVYELGGDTPFTLSQFAEEVAGRYGEPFAYVDHSPEELPAVFAELGLPPFFAPVAAETGAQARRGELFTDSRDLSRLLARPSTSLRSALGLIQ